MTRPQPEPRSSWPHFMSLTTRWMDNDQYGHLNNVVYYSLFDTVINRFLIESGLLDPHHGSTIGLVVASQCDYFDSLAYPHGVDAGLRVGHIGRSSVRYEIGLFAAGAALCAARGRVTHAYVERGSRRPTALSDPFIQTLRGLT